MKYETDFSYAGQEFTLCCNERDASDMEVWHYVGDWQIPDLVQLDESQIFPHLLETMRERLREAASSSPYDTEDEYLGIA